MTKTVTPSPAYDLLFARFLPTLLGCFVAISLLIPGSVVLAQTCPVIGGIDGPDRFCAVFPFTVTATGLQSLTGPENGETDFSIAFVYLPAGSTADPYVDGVLLGNTPAVDGVAELFETGADLPVNNYAIYAILSPAPADVNCRPQQLLALNLTPCDDLGNFAFLDFDNNGVFAGDDVPLPQVVARLYDATSDVELFDRGPETTNANGNYWYALVPPGDYFFRFDAPAGYLPAALPAVPGNNTNRIDPAAGNGPTSTPDFTFAATSVDYSFDAAFVGPGTIGGTVWADDDFGFDFDEPGIAGVALSLTWDGPDGAWSTTDDVTLAKVAATGGAFNFPNLPYGHYRLAVTSVAGTILQNGYALASPAVTPVEFTIAATATDFANAEFIYQPLCLPSTGRLLTNDPLILCGNANEGIYANQQIRVTLSNFVAPAAIPTAYAYRVLVVNAAGTIVQVHPLNNPQNGAQVTVDLVGLPTGAHTIQGVHYLTTDPDLAVPLNFGNGALLQPLLDRLTLVDGQANAGALANVCGDISHLQNNLVANTEPQPPVYLGCLGFVNVSLNNQCGATVTPAMVLVGDWGCLRPVDFQVSIYQNGQLVSTNGQLSGCGGYEYRIDLLLPGSSGFPCWGYINARDVTPPAITCPPTISGSDNVLGAADFSCTDIDLLRLTAPAAYIVDGNGVPVSIPPTLRAILDITGYPTVTDGCDFVRIYVSDAVTQNGNCGDTYITRTFFAEDKYESGCGGTPNISAVCTQRINFRKVTIDEVLLPPNLVELDCSAFGGQPNPTPAQINAALGVLGYPAVNSFFDANPATPAFDPHLVNQVYCNIGASYEDHPRVTVCGSSYSFLREWYIFDKCNLSSVLEFTQLIKVKDNTNPTLVLPTVDYNNDGVPDVRRYSTAPYDCFAHIPLPAPTELTDICLGPATVTITVTDANNTILLVGGVGGLLTVPPGNYTFAYCASDGCGNETCIPMPVIVRDEIAPTVICNNALIVQIGGGDIANGLSGIARVMATSVDEGSNDNCSPVTLAVRRNYWNNNDCSLNPNQFSPWGEYIDFYCCDIARSVTIELRATDAVGNTNSCWLNLVPEDKLKPFCYAPANQTVTCAELPLLFSGDLQDAYADDFAATSLLLSQLFGGPTGTDNCAVDTLVERTPNININACGWGTLVRRFETWQLKPEGDANGNGIIDASEVLRSTNSCSQTITITETHQYVIDFPADAIADCLDPDIAAIVTEATGCDNLAINIGEPQRFSATGDECYKLSITYDVINWCIWDGEADAYQVTRQTDTDDSVVDACERPVVRVNDSGASIDRNHPEPGCGSNLADNFPVPAAQNVGRWRYTQFVKVYDNSEPTFTVAPFGGPTATCPDLPAGVFGSLDNDNCTAPILISFSLDDACEVFDYTGTLVLSLTGATIDWFAQDTNADGLIDANEFNPEDNVLGQVVPQGGTTFLFTSQAPVIPSTPGENVYHTLRLEAVDGCGNPAARYVSFRVVDCQASAPICISGLTATLTPNAGGECEAAIWATDFLGSPITDCSGSLSYAIYRAADVLTAGPGFVPSASATSLVLTMNDEETTVLYIYAIDGAGNFGYCETYVLVQPSFVCLALGAIGGMIRTEEERPVASVQLSLSGPMPMSTMSQADGSYVFENLEEDFDYTVTAFRNDNHLNGVTTFDIVLISKHILGLQPLDSPYKRIAADVNHSESITTLDIIHMRKLILNIYEEFPSNTSWRFIDQRYHFPAPENPWQEFFPELININDLIGENLNAAFIGIKIGDVNGSAVPGM